MDILIEDSQWRMVLLVSLAAVVVGCSWAYVSQHVRELRRRWKDAGKRQLTAGDFPKWLPLRTALFVAAITLLRAIQSAITSDWVGAGHAAISAALWLAFPALAQVLYRLQIRFDLVLISYWRRRAPWISASPRSGQV